MLTGNDVKRLVEVFATKDYITDYIDSKIDALEHRINDNHDKLYKEELSLKINESSSLEFAKD